MRVALGAQLAKEQTQNLITFEKQFTFLCISCLVSAKPKITHKEWTIFCFPEPIKIIPNATDKMAGQRHQWEILKYHKFLNIIKRMKIYAYN